MTDRSALTRAFHDALMRRPEVTAGTVNEGAAWLVNAVYGRTMREHFDTDHPGDIAEGERLGSAGKEGPEREAWLWGYRWSPTEPGGQ
jgi:hypothetical protein